LIWQYSKMQAGRQSEVINCKLTTEWRRMVEVEGKLRWFLTWMLGGGQWSVSLFGLLAPGRKDNTSPRTGLDLVTDTRAWLCRESNHDRPARNNGVPHFKFVCNVPAKCRCRPPEG
jgi:hypothetical protein